MSQVITPKRKHEPLIDDRFWAKVVKTDTCWLWAGYVMPNGYGQVRREGKAYLCHRWAWKITYGHLPDNKVVAHVCDVRNCVNPDHLWLGTQEDNLLDMYRKGRAIPFAGIRPDNRGERQGRATLTDKQVLEIRNLAVTSSLSHQAIANLYGVRRQTVSRVLAGDTWSHL